MKDRATIYVDVPIRSGEPLSDVSISVTDLSDLDDRPTSPTAMEQMLDVDKPRRCARCPPSRWTTFEPSRTGKPSHTSSTSLVASRP
jgi:hypothetical protein